MRRTFPLDNNLYTYEVALIPSIILATLMPAEAEFLCSPWTSKATFLPYHLDARHSFLVFQGCSSFPDLSGLGPLDFFPKT